MLSAPLLAGARTVAHMATYFEELKQAARTLQEHGKGEQRGYLTPHEDDAIKQLLVSYWQSRNALLDLVISYRDDAGLSAELRPRAFLVAYAAAILLVDAARFLRESFHDRPVVRQKLNEPDQQFGIPAGIYDAVQHSLTRTWHAWHLYHAIGYFREHEAALRILAGSDQQLSLALEVVDRLGARLEVPIAQFLKTRMRVRTSQTFGMLRQDVVGQALYGLQKLIGCLASGVCVRPGHQPGLPPAIADEIRQTLLPGDVLITRKEYAVTNYFLPGYWPHAALYLGDADSLAEMGLETNEHVRPRWSRLLEPRHPEPRRVLEALKDGVWIRSLESPLASDSLVAIRPHLSQADLAEALGRGMFHEGKPYDFDFDFSRSDRLVCTEVVYRTYDGIGGMQFPLVRRAGRLTLAAEDLLAMSLAHDQFTPVAVFAPAHSAAVLRGPEAESVLKARRVAGG